MTLEELRDNYREATGEDIVNSLGEPDIDYVHWLEEALLRKLEQVKKAYSDLGQHLGKSV